MSDLKKSDLGKFSGGGAVIGSPVVALQFVKLLSMDFHCLLLHWVKEGLQKKNMNPVDFSAGDIDQIQ